MGDTKHRPWGRDVIRCSSPPQTQVPLWCWDDVRLTARVVDWNGQAFMPVLCLVPKGVGYFYKQLRYPLAIQMPNNHERITTKKETEVPRAPSTVHEKILFFFLPTLYSCLCLLILSSCSPALVSNTWNTLVCPAQV